MSGYRVLVVVPAESVYPQRPSKLDMERVADGAAQILAAARAAVREGG